MKSVFKNNNNSLVKCIIKCVASLNGPRSFGDSMAKKHWVVHSFCSELIKNKRKTVLRVTITAPHL